MQDLIIGTLAGLLCMAAVATIMLAGFGWLGRRG